MSAQTAPRPAPRPVAPPRGTASGLTAALLLPSAGAAGPQAGDTFADYRDRLTHAWLANVTVLGFSLIPLFLVLDYFTMPAELLVQFAGYRALATLAVLLQHFLIRRTRPTRLSFLHGYAFTLVVGGMITRMTVDLGGFDSSYYAGLCLVVVAANLLPPWRAVHSAINGLLVLGMYVAANLVWGGPFELASLINNLYFLGATVVIAVAISHTKHGLIQKEFELRAELLEANTSLDRSRHELREARDALWGEMEVAKRIQTALLPGNRRLGRFDVAATMVPAAEVGGDYFDFLETDRGEHWVGIGDVSGHGVESGLVMMMTQTSLLSLVTHTPGLTPSQAFRAVNRAVRENISRLQSHRFMTLNIIRVHDDRLTLAGKHQDLLVWRRASGQVEVVSNAGCWLGVVPDTAGLVEDHDVPLAEGDVVLLYTDGVTEATDARGQMYGEERLAHALQSVAHLPLEDGLGRLLDEVRGFQAKQEDDVTLMLMRLGPPRAA